MQKSRFFVTVHSGREAIVLLFRKGVEVLPEAYQALEAKLKNIVAEHLGIESVEAVQLDSNLIDDLGADSLDMVEMIMALEEAFIIEIPNEDAENVETFGELVAYVATAVPDFTAS